MILDLMDTTVTVVTRDDATVDSEGDWVPGTATSNTWKGRLRQVSGDERNEGRLQADTDYILDLQADATVAHDDQVTIAGDRYEITARPGLLQSPITTLAFWRVELKRVG